MSHFRLLFIFLSLYFASPLRSIASTIITSNSEVIDISNDLLLGKETPKINEKNSLNFGYFPGERWARISLRNPEAFTLNKLIYFDTITGKLSLYASEEKEHFEELMQTGSSIPYNKRIIKSIYAAFPITLNPHTEKTFLFKITSPHNFNSKVYVGDSTTIKERENYKLGFLYFYVGGIACLILYNFFIFIFLKDKNYLLYSFFSTCFTLVILCIHGVLDKVFHPNNFTFSHYLICFSSLALISATLFTYYFFGNP